MKSMLLHGAMVRVQRRKAALLFWVFTCSLVPQEGARESSSKKAQSCLNNSGEDTKAKSLKMVKHKI